MFFEGMEIKLEESSGLSLISHSLDWETNGYLLQYSGLEYN